MTFTLIIIVIKSTASITAVAYLNLARLLLFRPGRRGRGIEFECLYTQFNLETWWTIQECHLELLFSSLPATCLVSSCFSSGSYR